MTKLLDLLRSAVKARHVVTQLIRTFGECIICHLEKVVVTAATSDGSIVEHSPMICPSCYQLAMAEFSVKEKVN